MSWTSLFLEMNNKKIFILGTGEVATRRANRFLDKGAEVVLAGDHVDQELIKKGAKLIPIKPIEDLKNLVKESDIVITASGDKELSDYIASISKDKLLNRADAPNEGNLIVPTSFLIENIEISIFTNGQSPLMAKELRKKIQNTISPEDLLEIKLQDYGRQLLKTKIANQKERRDYLYNILNNEEIKILLKENKLEKAKELVKKIIYEN